MYLIAPTAARVTTVERRVGFFFANDAGTVTVI